MRMILAVIVVLVAWANHSRSTAVCEMRRAYNLEDSDNA